MVNPVGEAGKGVLSLAFYCHLRPELRGARVTTDAGLLAIRELDEVLGLTDMAGAMRSSEGRKAVLDMDSSESPVHGSQEGSASGGHFRSRCYHPLLVFDQHGDCEGAMLRPGNVHSADGWRDLLEPIVDTTPRPRFRPYPETRTG